MDEDNFNAGVLSFDPDQRVYDELMAEHLNSTSYVWHGWAEQGLLNWCEGPVSPSTRKVLKCCAVGDSLDSSQEEGQGPGSSQGLRVMMMQQPRINQPALVPRRTPRLSAERLQLHRCSRAHHLWCPSAFMCIDPRSEGSGAEQCADEARHPWQ